MQKTYNTTLQAEEIVSRILDQNQLYRLLYQFRRYSSSWTINIIAVIMVFWLLGSSVCPEWLADDPQAAQSHRSLLFAIKGMLVYSLMIVLLVVVHQAYGTDLATVFKSTDKNMFKNIISLCLKLAVFYNIAVNSPVNIQSDMVLAVLLVYMMLSQKLLRSFIVTAAHSVYCKKGHFISSFNASMATAMPGVLVALFEVLLPCNRGLAVIAGFVPVTWRFALAVVDNSRQSLCNALKFFLGLFVIALTVSGQPTAAFYCRILSTIYSFYWDIFRDWKWGYRFLQTKNYRIDLPLWTLVVVFIYNAFGRSAPYFIVMGSQTRTLLQISRRALWGILRVERETVFTMPKTSPSLPVKK